MHSHVSLEEKEVLNIPSDGVAHKCHNLVAKLQMMKDLLDPIKNKPGILSPPFRMILIIFIVFFPKRKWDPGSRRIPEMANTTRY